MAIKNILRRMYLFQFGYWLIHTIRNINKYYKAKKRFKKIQEKGVNWDCIYKID